MSNSNTPYPLASIENKQRPSGSDAPLFLIAGPCSVESEVQIHSIAKEVAAAGGTHLRGGVFKPRTSPYEFQGLGAEAIVYFSEAAKANGLKVVSEVMDLDQLEQIQDYVDVLQVGTRNMYNYPLLKALGKQRKPVILKRGFSATYKEFILAAEYILLGGNEQVILCERGVRSFDSHTRNLLDVTAVPALSALTHLPIIVDPSHGTGLRHCVEPMACAAMAAGANGVIIEAHTSPDQALTDSKQTISTSKLKGIFNKLISIRGVINAGENVTTRDEDHKTA